MILGIVGTGGMGEHNSLRDSLSSFIFGTGGGLGLNGEVGKSGEGGSEILGQLMDDKCGILSSII